MTNDALQRAIEYLHAVEVAPGRYAIRPPANPSAGRYRVLSADQLVGDSRPWRPHDDIS